jgi:hypothetical protein
MSPQWQTKLITDVCMIACGDLILSALGNLHTRQCYDENYNSLPYEQHKLGQLLGAITRDGWHIPASGAAYMLENWRECFSAAQIRGLEKIKRGEA